MESPSTPGSEPTILWRPDPGHIRDIAIVQFARWAGMCRDTRIDDELDYQSLHAWSVRDPDGFWSAAAGFLEVMFHDPPTATLGSTENSATPTSPPASVQSTNIEIARPHQRIDKCNNRCRD